MIITDYNLIISVTFINDFNWEGINSPSKIEDWKRFEQNNPRIALNMLYIKGKDICPAFISNIYSTCEKRNNFLNDSKCRKRSLALFCSK